MQQSYLILSHCYTSGVCHSSLKGAPVLVFLSDVRVALFKKPDSRSGAAGFQKKLQSQKKYNASTNYLFEKTRFAKKRSFTRRFTAAAAPGMRQGPLPAGHAPPPPARARRLARRRRGGGATAPHAGRGAADRDPPAGEQARQESAFDRSLEQSHYDSTHYGYTNCGLQERVDA